MTESEMFQHDEAIFLEKLRQWKLQPVENKYIVLNCGIGDHYAFRSILPSIKKAYPNKKLILAVCYPEVFEDENIQLISIANAKQLGINVEENGGHNVYTWMDQNHWQKPLYQAFEEMYKC